VSVAVVSLYVLHLRFVFLADPEELCEDAGLSVCSSSGAQSHDALQQRTHAAEERASTSEQALTRAMDDLHKLKSVVFLHLFLTTTFSI